MKNNKNEKFLDRYFEFISDTEGLSKEEVVEFLEEEGINTEKLKIRISQIVSSMSEKRRLAWREKARKKRSLVESLISKKETNFKTNLQERIKQFLSIHGETHLADVYFRKRDDLSEDDLENLINDIDDLNLLDEFFESEDK